MVVTWVVTGVVSVAVLGSLWVSRLQHRSLFFYWPATFLFCHTHGIRPANRSSPDETRREHGDPHGHPEVILPIKSPNFYNLKCFRLTCFLRRSELLLDGICGQA